LALSKFTSAFVAPNAIAYDPVSGGALITGTVNWSPPTGGIFAVDANGSFRWGSFASATAVPYDAAIDGNGTAFIATTRLLNGQLDAGFVAFDESGTLLHERRLYLPNDEYGWSVGPRDRRGHPFRPGHRSGTGRQRVPLRIQLPLSDAIRNARERRPRASDHCILAHRFGRLACPVRDALQSRGHPDRPEFPRR